MLTRNLFFRELVILNECEESQNRVKERCFALLRMTNNIGSTAILLLKIIHRNIFQQLSKTV